MLQALLLTVLLGALPLAGVAPLCAAAGEDAASAPTTQAALAPRTAATPVGLIAIDGEIDGLRARYFQRVLAQAQADGVGTLIVHITSDGGELFAGRDMLMRALALPDSGPRLIAFVDDRAISAAAMIAYGHHEIWMTPQASIGDIGVIMMGADQKIEYAPEKIETVVRGLLRLAAERRGWDQAKLVKMTARDQDLYRIDLDGAHRFVLEHDLPSWLADHPHADPATQKLVLPHDTLMYYTAREAVEAGMATGIAGDLGQLYATLGVDAASVRSYAPTGVERVSWYLAGWSGLLLGLGVLCLVLEFKAPSGLWVALGALLFTGFFVCQYYQELAGNLEIVLVVLGLLAIAADILVLPTGGILALVGGVAVLVGGALAFMPDDVQFHPGSDGFGEAAHAAMAQIALSLAVMAGGGALIVWRLPRSRAIARLAANAEITATSAGADEASGNAVGRRGVARTDLRPGGFVVVDGRDLSAVSENGEQIDAGTPVAVVAMRFGEAIVTALGSRT